MKKSSRRIYNSKSSEVHRKELRNALTPAEALLWSQLKQRQAGKKFRRQYSVGPYILDFYCPEIRLAMRFENELVHRELEWVVGVIRERIRIIS